MRRTIAAVLFVAGCGPARPMQHADLILKNGPGGPVAIAGDRIVAATSAARTIDLAGRCVLPGFIDAHVHFVGGGLETLGPDLHGTASEADFARRLGEAAGRLAPGSWVTGGGWDHEAWPGRAYPHRRAVDPLTPDHPVLVSRTDGHIAFANGRALTLAGVTRETRDPAGGVIVRDADGTPTGVLKDAAIGLVDAKVPSSTADERLRAARAAMALAAKNGVTTIHDMGGGADYEVYRKLEAAGELTVRVRFYFPMAQRARAIEAAAGGSDLLRVRGTKAFSDGSLGAGTAFMFEPFSDEPANRGLRDASFEDRAAFLAALLEVDRAGLQTCVHAIGDRANREVLDLFEEVTRVNGPRDRRARVEHAQHLTAADIPRFAALGVVPSMQPYHCIDDGRWAERRLGTTRSRTTYPFRSLLEARAPLAFGSDWFVAPLEPLQTIHAAVTRVPLGGTRSWVPEERITPAEAIRCHTEGGAWAAFDERDLGKLEPGFLADLVVLSEDPRKAARIGDIKVEMTIVGGRIVYEGKEVRR